LVVMPLVLTWICDTCAMAAGTWLGGARLAPVLSPRKTWAGAIGGSVGALAAALLYGPLVLDRVAMRLGALQLVTVGAAVGVVALTAHSNAELLEDQAAEWRPAYVGLVNSGKGADCLVEAATRADVQIVVNAVVGAAGLEATLAALRAGKRVALANKEALVMAGELVSEAARAGGGESVPVDSEHSAVLQCITGRRPGELARLILTASGGPFRTWTPERLAGATVAEALQHPTWKMGKKITVDSATLVNKALEVIEAHFLFGLPYPAVQVVVHPQSVVHAFVEFVDGSVLAQVGFPTMELPILYALTHPERVPDRGAKRFDPVEAGAVTFEPVRPELYPAY